MDRFFRALLIACTVGFSWLAMQVVHEGGHVLHARLSGGEVARIVVHPLTISRTDLSVNPRPQFVAWGGPLWGSLIPVGFWSIIRRAAPRYAYLTAWFAGFCLVANGGYLVGGAFLAGGEDDGGTILRHGGARWQLLTFGVPAVAAGLWVWNGLGPSFGFGSASGKVDRRAAIGVATALVALVIAECLLTG